MGIEQDYSTRRSVQVMHLPGYTANPWLCIPHYMKYNNTRDTIESSADGKSTQAVLLFL